MIKYLFFLCLVPVLQTRAQEIKRWKIQDLENYIRHSDSPLVANFWATYCVPCKEELPYFQTTIKEYSKQKIKLLLVSLDQEKDYPGIIREYLKSAGIIVETVWLDETDADYFIPKIDSAWSGAIPATLLVSPHDGKRLFFDHQMKPKELEKAIEYILQPPSPSKKRAK